ncbi:uncharacterized protein LOC133193337 isoform X1 [Saccostrea echinata]|uniref:uncharacterized protein LOC133193337 isoform X1 n=1 Tax=Saccostrea echinata TaxID=191078 RepID=UPI002A7EF15F|nr:uncharacterized protein LOC133193337 isoform X1 [Saccostrea echinata]XP_061185263.1 uncharacterized protein LOC133193337 isoform X1 [Saccostrea echinata]
MSVLAECPPLLSLPKTETAHETPNVILNTRDRYFGAEVTISCPGDYHVVGKNAAKCLESGSWDLDRLPHCSDITYGVPDSTKLYIAVFASCGVLVILSFAILIARILCVFRRPLAQSSRDDLGKSTESVASIRYFPQDAQYQETVIDMPQKDGRFESFCNPGYVSNEAYPQTRWHTEHAHNGWRGRQSSYDSSFENESSLGYIVDEPDDTQRAWNSTGSTDVYENDRYNRLSRQSRIQEVIEDDRTPF